jgi:sodium-independent sulfate anion transporter 11
MFWFTQSLKTEYLIITPDRSLVFTAIEYFISCVRKASALHPGIIVVIDMSHVSAADFTTSYVILPEILFKM